MKTRLLIIDDNKSMVEMIREYFKMSTRVEVVLEANDGEKGYETIKNNIDDFDIVLLDLIMPKRDGLYVLDKMKEEGINKGVIVFTSFSEEETIRKVSEYGVKYFVLKPFVLEELEKKINELHSSTKKPGEVINLKSKSIEIPVTKLLHELGIPSHIKGYNYIREAITLIYLEPSLIGSVTKKLYPEIAIKFGTTVSRVERAIRHAIEVSWLRGDWDLMEEIFGHSVDIDRAKPTNSEFIVTIADKLRLEMIKI